MAISAAWDAHGLTGEVFIGHLPAPFSLEDELTLIIGDEHLVALTDSDLALQQRRAALIMAVRTEPSVASVTEAWLAFALEVRLDSAGVTAAITVGKVAVITALIAVNEAVTAGLRAA